MIDLYYRPGAASLPVHAALEEAGAEYNLIRATRENGVFGPPEAARLNPAGRVPTMSFDGMAMTESVACLMHISDLYPDAALAPTPGTPERGRWYRWLIYLVNPVQSTFYGFIAPGRSAPVEAQDAVKARAIESLDSFRTTLDTYLASSGPYLLGERFSSADLFLFMLTRWGRRLKHRWWDAPALAEHYLKVKDRPAMKRVFEQEGLDDDA
ncbi:MAG: glutathione S-transferase family protein [Solirubrobacteraceae bacterium]